MEVFRLSLKRIRSKQRFFQGFQALHPRLRHPLHFLILHGSQDLCDGLLHELRAAKIRQAEALQLHRRVCDKVLRAGLGGRGGKEKERWELLFAKKLNKKSITKYCIKK